MTLHLYLWHRLIRYVLLILFVLVTLSFFLELEVHLNSQRFEDVSTRGKIGLALLKVPEVTYELIPLVFLLGALATMIRLALDSETIVIKSAGRAGYSTILSLAVFSLILGIGVIVIASSIVVVASRYYSEIERLHDNQETRIFIEQDGQVWLRQTVNDRMAVIRAASTTGAEHFFDVDFFLFDSNGLPTRRHNAEVARLRDGEWQLIGVKSWKIDNETERPEEFSTHAESIFIPTDISRDEIVARLLPPNYTFIWKSAELIRRLNVSGFSVTRHRVHFQAELSLPVLLAAMTILGSVFVQGPARERNLATGCVISVVLGLGLFFAKNFVRVLGESETLPVILAAWAVPVSALCLALAVVIYAEHV